MANAGELVIKIAADYAQLTTAMSEVNSKLTAFGDNVARMHGRMGQAFNVLRGALVAMGAAFSVQQVLAYGDAIEKTVGDMADMAENLKLSADEFQAFQNAAYLAGQKTEAVASALGKFNVFIGKASEGSKEQVERLNDLGIKILDVNGKLRPQADLLTEVAQRLLKMEDGAKRAAAEVAFFGKSGQAVSATLEQWAKGTAKLNAELEAQGLRHSPEVVKQLDALSDRADKAAKRMEVFFAPFYAAAKTSVMDWLSDALTAFVTDLQAISAHSNIIDKIIALLGAIGKGGGVEASKTFATEQNQKAIERLTQSIEYLEQAEKNLQKTTREGLANPALDNVRARLDADRAALAQMKIARGDVPQEGAFTLPPVTVTGNRNPGIKGASDAIDAEIEKLRIAAVAADKTIADLSKYSGEPFERFKQSLELSRAILVKQDELAAKAKETGANFGQNERDKINDYMRRVDALKQVERATAAADATERRFGNSERARAAEQEGLQEQLKTGVLSAKAYEHALKDLDERMKDLGATYARAEGGIEALSAGFEKAARDYEKANDAFSMGGRIFNGIVGVMDQSLDVLAGTSSKTFDQIAADFGRMLAKMALQAALSPVFKWVTGSLTGGGGIDAEIANWSSYGSGGGGGGIFSWLGGLFGGNRAVGGDVQPGMSYMVGEHGPERFTPTGAGNITPYAARDTGGVTVNLDLSQTQGTRDPAAALEFGRRIRAAVVDVVKNEQRPGGLLYGGT